jgi:hypothetical protein
MPSTAIPATGAIVQIATGTAAAKNVTAVALTNPCRVTLNNVTGLNVGDVVAFAAIVGTVQLNGNSYVVQYIETGTNIITLAGVNATGFTAWTSGGTATPTTYTTIGNAVDFSGLDGQNSEIKVTNLASVAEEFLEGLSDGGHIKINLDLDNNDLGQQSARTAQQNSQKKNFKIILPAGVTPNISFAAIVKQFSITGKVNDAMRASIDLRLTGLYTLS